MRTQAYIFGLIMFFGILFLPTQTYAQLSPGDLMESHKHLEGMSKCTECHSLGEKISNDKCLSCHATLNTLIQDNLGYHSSNEVKSKQCVSCHSDHHGRKFKAIRFEEKSFNHALAGFELEGAHQKVDCRACHQSSNIQDKSIAKRGDTWLGLEQECLSCHDDFHQQTLKGSCLSCHDMNQFSPASKFNHDKADFKLVGAHKQVDCKSCHAETTKNGKPFQQFNDLKFNSCVDCHTDVHEGKFGENCKQCHSETSFSQLKSNVSFNHDLTGFSLTGQHKTVSCESCHGEREFSSSFDSKQCKSCHSDFHKGQFTRKDPKLDCKDCHSVYKTFDYTTYGIERHNSSAFALEGAHLATPCFACHLQTDYWEFRDLGNDCIDCHGDVHKEKISDKFYNKQNCTSCHSNESWSAITFDHLLTGFELEGNHKTSECRDCHYNSSIKPETVVRENQNFSSLTDQCAQCHQNVHGNQFEVENETDCRRCHATSVEWKADNFEHGTTKFPLKGKHAQVDCNACHKPKEDENGRFNTEFKIQKFECIDCHS